MARQEHNTISSAGDLADEMDRETPDHLKWIEEFDCTRRFSAFLWIEAMVASGTDPKAYAYNRPAISLDFTRPATANNERIYRWANPKGDEQARRDNREAIWIALMLRGMINPPPVPGEVIPVRRLLERPSVMKF
jgi:hypothetical protein